MRAPTATKMRFGVLDLYRFVAAFGVAALHFAQFAKYDPNIGFGYAVGDFALFVDFFFILSGFVIGVNYSDRVQTMREIFTFLRRRIARVYPLYLLTLLAFVFPAWLGISKAPLRDPGSIFQDALLLSSWELNPTLPYNFPAWSVSVEWAMYVLFPFMMVLVHKLGNVALLLIIVAGFAAIEFVLQAQLIQPPLWFANISPLRAVPTFALGVLVSRYFSSIEIPHALLAGVLLFCTSVLLTIAHANVYFILALTTASIFLTANSYISGKTSMLDGRLFGLLGDASYSLYMLHAFFLTVGINMLWPHISSEGVSVAYGALLLSIATAFSLLTFSLFEKPARDLISGRTRSRAAAQLQGQA